MLNYTGSRCPNLNLKVTYNNLFLLFSLLHIFTAISYKLVKIVIRLCKKMYKDKFKPNVKANLVQIFNYKPFHYSKIENINSACKFMSIFAFGLTLLLVINSLGPIDSRWSHELQQSVPVHLRLCREEFQYEFVLHQFVRR